MGLIYLSAAIAYPMMIAGALKHVVRGEAPRMPFYLSYGLDEIRILLSYIILVIMVSLVAFVGVFAMMALGLAFSALSADIGGIVTALLILAMVLRAFSGSWFACR